MGLKVLHLSVAKGFPGLLKQLEYEHAAAKELSGVEWYTLGFVYQPNEKEFIKKIPVVFQGIFRRKLFAWLWLLRNARKYDYVLIRHMTFDPFSFVFAWLVRNRVTIFHSKSEYELRLIRRGWKGWAAAKLENITGRIASRTASGILGVTNEIKEYQRESKKLGSEFPTHVYPNGIRAEKILPVEDERKEDVIEVGFMCGQFTSWHGLDVVLDYLQEAFVDSAKRKPIVLHLIGQLSQEQELQARKINDFEDMDKVVVHGVLEEKEYREVWALCHIGLGSLAMYRNDLSEATTLKVREMLAFGIPVYSGHKDAALPDDFPYYCSTTGSLDQFVAFAESVRGVPRNVVREAALPYIEKRECMQSVASFLQRLQS